MNSAKADINAPAAVDVRIDEESLAVDLADGRTIIVPVAWFPWLQKASQKQRGDWSLLEGGHKVQWQSLKSHLFVQDLLAAHPGFQDQLNSIRDFAVRIGEDLNAEQIILFGSHAQGRANRDSDVDLLIIAESDLPRLKRLQKLHATAPERDFPVDFLWYTPQEIEEHRGQDLTMPGRILKEGMVLYARGD